MTRDIIINGRFLARRVTGVERYGQEIVKLFRSSHRVEKMRLNGAAGHLWEQFVLPTKLTSKSVLWSPANTGPLLVHNQALTIHDLSPLVHPEWFSKNFAMWYRLFLPILARRVQIVFTPSEYSKQKVQKQLGVKNVIVTPNGVDTAIFHPEASRMARAASGGRHGFAQSLFQVGGNAGTSLGPLLAAWIIVPHGQVHVLWFTILALVGIFILCSTSSPTVY